MKKEQQSTKKKQSSNVRVTREEILSGRGYDINHLSRLTDVATTAIYQSIQNKSLRAKIIGKKYIISGKSALKWINC
jgi:hypothetical protein